VDGVKAQVFTDAHRYKEITGEEYVAPNQGSSKKKKKTEKESEAKPAAEGEEAQEAKGARNAKKEARRAAQIEERKKMEGDSKSKLVCRAAIARNGYGNSRS
jgi:hypothetical protein